MTEMYFRICVTKYMNPERRYMKNGKISTFFNVSVVWENIRSCHEIIFNFVTVP